MSEERRLGVLGGGTMGAGIAQVAAEAGFEVLLHDPVEGAVARARDRIGGFLRRKVEKGQLTNDDAIAALGRLQEASAPETLAREAAFVIEAVPEDLALKRDVFARLDAASSDGAVLATNTSSLSVAEIAAATANPHRVVGMHFFNPVPLMALVEVIGGPASAPAAVEAAHVLAERLGKTPVHAADLPGFIVNRVQRAYYLEGYRILAEGLAGIEGVDAAMRGIGFRLGPFELADVVGTDVNLAAGIGIYERFYFDPRYRPQLVQRQLVAAGRLGRKSGGGYYDYAEDGTRGAPWAELARRGVAPRLAPLDAARIEARILAAIVNEAASAVQDGVASPEAIDVAMRLGTNWPEGPLAWGERIGLARIVATLDALHATAPDGRYRVAPLLRSLAERGGTFFEAQA